MSNLTPARIACRRLLGQPLPNTKLVDREAIASCDQALRSRPATITVLEACRLLKNGATVIRCHPGDATGLTELVMLCKRQFGAGLTLENLNRLLGDLALRPGWTPNLVNALPLGEFVSAFIGDSRPPTDGTKGQPGRRGYPLEALELALDLRRKNPLWKAQQIRKECLKRFTQDELPATADDFRRWMNRPRKGRAKRAN